MSIIYGIIGSTLAVLALAVVYLKKVPHGWVQLKTGLALKFLPSLDSAPVVELRHGLERFVDKKRAGIAKALPVAKDEYIDIPTRHGDIKARVLVPNQIKEDKICVLIHGGGWCIGSTKTYEEVSRRLARTCGTTVVSLEYSLAPEHTFPIAHEECEDAVTWITQRIDKIQVGATHAYLVGDSAGGNLIVSTIYEVSAEVREKISHLIPVYPAVDGVKRYYSNEAYADGYYLTDKAMVQFSEALITDRAQLASRRMSPINNEMVDHYPKTFIQTADYDPLRDQGEAYAAKLKTEGVDVRLKRYHGTIHAFFGLKDFGDRGVKAIEDIATFLRGDTLSDLMPLS